MQPPSLAALGPVADVSVVGLSGAAFWPAVPEPDADAEVTLPNVPLEARSAYGGMHCFCTGSGVGVTQSVGVVGPPSNEMGPAQATFEMACGSASHVQPDRQSPFDAQTTAFAWQCEVESVVVVQTGATGTISVGPPSSEEAAPPLPAQEPTSSRTHANPSPQSEADVHGKRYLGTHCDVVVIVQAGGAAVGVAQTALGGHAGVAWSGQFRDVCE